MPAGKYTTRFEANNMTSGVYYYQIQADGLNQTKKMTLIK